MQWYKEPLFVDPFESLSHLVAGDTYHVCLNPFVDREGVIESVLVYSCEYVDSYGLAIKYGHFDMVIYLPPIIFAVDM